ncbi:MAG: undecaprenyldiphospho-muramoylpentapeptide beta-N-acetylglucosaminyltransferase [Vulcanimicrobiaceae bacterium]
MRVIFAGGGTGGHLYPAIAIADALGKSAEITFIGTADRLEARIVPAAGYRLLTVTAAPLQRGPSLGSLRGLAANVGGVTAAMRLIGELRPDIVIATGGYVSVPVVVAARIRRWLGMPVALALLEPNALAGLSNTLLAPLVDEVWGAAFARARGSMRARVVVTGVPVRSALAALPSREAAARRLGLDPSLRTVLVLGGSQGARSLNELVVAFLSASLLPSGWQVLLVAGERDGARLEGLTAHLGAAVRVVGYLPEMADAYAVADLAVARAGASTLAEFVAVGLPSILVPYPYAARDHQMANARALASAGAAVVVEDAQFDAPRLAREFAALLEADRLQTMGSAARSLGRADPTALILARIEALIKRSKASI